MDTLLARQYLDSLTTQLDARNFEKAKEYGNKAIKIYQEKLGEENLLTAMAYYQLGKVAYESNDIDESFKSTRKALEIRLAILGEAHQEIANTYDLLGHIHYKNRSSKKARELYGDDLVASTKFSSGESKKSI